MFDSALEMCEATSVMVSLISISNPTFMSNTFIVFL